MADATVIAVAADAVASVPAPAVHGTTAFPTAVAAVASVPTPAVHGTTVFPAAVAAVVGIPAIVRAIDANTIAAPTLIGPYIQTGVVDDDISVESISAGAVTPGPLWISESPIAPFGAPS